MDRICRGAIGRVTQLLWSVRICLWAIYQTRGTSSLERGQMLKATQNRFGKPAGTVWDYVSIARPDHAIKHLLIVPGILLAWVLRHDQSVLSPLGAALTLLACVLSASANYVINEWLDASFDTHHPSKVKRPCVDKDMKAGYIILEYVALAALALCTAAATAPLVVYATTAFLVSGVIYNVPPFRSKDVVLFDVVSESINNPIRLIFGWAMVDPTTLPPASILLAYWLGGAFLMNTKRLAEFRDVAGHASGDKLHLYRRSFRQYSERRLLFLSFLYAQISLACAVMFIVKYRIEYVLSVPLVATLFSIYFYIGLKPRSAAQTPEKLFTEPLLWIAVIGLTIALIILTYFNIPHLESLLNARFVKISW